MITQATAGSTMRRGLGLEPSTYFTRRRESYFFDYVKDELIKEYGAKTVRLGGLQVCTTVDLKKQQEARAAIAERLGDIGPSSAIVTINPQERLHPGDGVLGRLRRVEVQPRRPGPPPARLDVQGDGADGRAARGRRPRRDALLVASRRRSSTTRRTARSTSRPTPTPARGNISLRKATLHSDNSVYIQLALDVGPDKVKQAAWDLGHPLQAQRLSGRDARRPRPTASRRSRWPTPTRRSPPAAMRNRPTAITQGDLPRRPAKELPARWKVKRTRAF